MFGVGVVKLLEAVIPLVLIVAVKEHAAFHVEAGAGDTSEVHGAVGLGAVDFVGFGVGELFGIEEDGDFLGGVTDGALLAEINNV